MHIWLQALLALLFSAVFFEYTRRKNALSTSGALAAIFVGLSTLYFAGWVWLIPLFFFFLSSTLLGKLNKTRLEAADAQQGRARNAAQVLCNGGIYTALAFLAVFPEWRETALYGMSVSMAVSTADTWASEIGIFFKQATYDVLRFRKVPPGLSGGVSAAGTLGGLAGGLLCGLLCAVLAGHWALALVIGLAGFAGMALDSVLGASLQARYLGPVGALSDQPIGPLKNGFAWMSNDGVNVLSNAVVTVISLFLI